MCRGMPRAINSPAVTVLLRFFSALVAFGVLGGVAEPDGAGMAVFGFLERLPAGEPIGDDATSGVVADASSRSMPNNADRSAPFSRPCATGDASAERSPV